MSIANLIRQMSEAGAPAEAIALAVEAIEAAGARDAERRAKQAARKAKSRVVAGQERDSHGTVTGQDCDNPPSPSLPPQTPPTRPHPPVGKSPARKGAGSEIDAEFAETFWPAYPEKVSKPKALEAFRKARGIASLDEIMAGLSQYVQGKPSDRAWAHPTTWLNQERWTDQPAPAPQLPFRVVNGNGPPKMKSVGHRLADEMGRLARGERDEPDPFRSDYENERTIDATAIRR